MKIEQILAKRIQQFPATPSMSDPEIKVNVYKAMEDWHNQESEKYKNALIAIRKSLPEGDEYDPGQVVFEVDEILLNIGF